METVETPQPTAPVEQKSTDWTKIILVAVVGFGLLAGSAYSGYYYGTQQVQPAEELTPAVSQPQPEADRPLDETPEPTTPPVTDPTAGWKTYSDTDMSFKYPPEWVASGYLVTSNSPKVRLVIVPKDNTLMTECMQETGVEDKGSFVIRKFSRVTTGAMCGTSDATPREVWIMKSLTAYAPGISYQYSSTESSQAESIFDQILSTFKFLE